ncbi:MAG: acyltransferase family protein [Candidatus Hodarchaeales archaeon]
MYFFLYPLKSGLVSYGNSQSIIEIRSLEFYPEFFSTTIDLLNFPFIFKATQRTGYFETGHLWFLVMLFAYSLLLLPIFIYLRRESSFHLIDRFGRFFDKSWTIFMLAIPISLIEVVFTAELFGGWNRYVYALLIIYGFLLASDKRIGKSLQKHWKHALVLGILLSMVYIVTVVIFAAILQTDPLISYDLLSILWRILKGITGWCWIIAILGFFSYKTQSQKEQLSEDKTTNSQGLKRILNPETMGSIGQYANKAQLPVYVLHQTIIVIVAFFIVPLDLNLYIKFLIISLLSLVITLLFYDIGVKRLRITRFLFGMKR